MSRVQLTSAPVNGSGVMRTIGAGEEASLTFYVRCPRVPGERILLTTVRSVELCGVYDGKSALKCLYHA